jgi:hypothetical protein
MIDRLNGRLAVLLASAMVLLVLLIGWFVLVSPKRSQAAGLASKNANAETQLSETQHLLHSSAARKSAAALAKVNRAMPTDLRMSQVVRQLTEAGRAAGVRVTGITPAALVTAPGGQAIPLTVLAEGHYFNLQRFVRLLRSATVVSSDSLHASGRLLAIDSIYFSNGQSNPNASGSGGKLITATLAVDAFTSAPGQQPGSTSTTSSASTSTTSP